MALVLHRRIAPHYDVWSGRKAFAALDAVGWPLGVAALVLGRWPQLAAYAAAVWTIASLVAVPNLYSAICRNERYRFTTARWAYLLALLCGVGLALKLLIALS